jgi:hypothetical protein
MRIEWKIQKNAGHLRPKLRYRLSLEPFELSLAVPMVRISSTIPKPQDAWQSHVWPGTLECGGKCPTATYDLCTPSHKTGSADGVLTLPARPDNRYPEVEESFCRLRRAYESALMDAYRNSAFEVRGSMEMTSETRQRIAPAAAAARFLQAVGLAPRPPAACADSGETDYFHSQKN